MRLALPSPWLDIARPTALRQLPQPVEASPPSHLAGWALPFLCSAPVTNGGGYADGVHHLHTFPPSVDNPLRKNRSAGRQTLWGGAPITTHNCLFLHIHETAKRPASPGPWPFPAFSIGEDEKGAKGGIFPHFRGYLCPRGDGLRFEPTTALPNLLRAVLLASIPGHPQQ